MNPKSSEAAEDSLDYMRGDESIGGNIRNMVLPPPQNHAEMKNSNFNEPEPESSDPVEQVSQLS